MGSSIDFADYGHGGWKVVIVAILLIVMQSLMVTGRYVSRRLRKVSLASDDYVLFLATVFTVGLCALALACMLLYFSNSICEKNSDVVIAVPRIAGVGSHIATIQSMNPSDATFAGQVNSFLSLLASNILAEQNQSFMAWMIIYGLSIALSKCAILLLYIRVFTTDKRAFTITAYIVGAVIVAAGIANTFIAILQCNPQSFAWNKSIKGGTCINVITWARYMAIPNVVTGAVMLIMPLPLVWRLNVSIAAKIALTATFLHGIM